MTFDLQSLQLRTSWAKSTSERLVRGVQEFKTDARMSERLKQRKCRACFYLRGPSVAGQAFTEWTCLGCSKTDMHSCTAVPMLCNECSDKFGACDKCGSDLDLKIRKELIRKRKVDNVKR